MLPGALLGEYEIERVLNEGRDSVVYLARDHGLQRPVVLREYLPAFLAGRAETGEIGLLAAEHAELFSLGLRAFAHEARLLARCEHPALVKVLRYWEASHTGYMVMRCYEGSSLLQVRQAMRRPPDEAWLRALLGDLLGALEVLHGAFGQHREIAPGNILIQPDGRPVLLGFHSARRVIAERGGPLGGLAEPAYAPLEAHPEASHLQQGPWSDLYSLAAVMYFCIAGHAPPTATSRAAGESGSPMSQAARALVGAQGPVRPYGAGFLAALDRAFQVQPQHRPHSATEWLTALRTATAPGPVGEEKGTSPPAEPATSRTPSPLSAEAMGATGRPLRTGETPTPSSPAGAGSPLPQHAGARGGPSPPRPSPESAGPSDEAVRAALAAALGSLPPDPRPASSARVPVAPPGSELLSSAGSLPQRRWLWGGAGVLALMAAAAGWQWKQQRDAQDLSRAMAGTAEVPAQASSPPSGAEPSPGRDAAREGGRSLPEPPSSAILAQDGTVASDPAAARSGREAGRTSPASESAGLPASAGPVSGAGPAAPPGVPAAPAASSVLPAPIRGLPAGPSPAASVAGAAPVFTSPRAACAPRERFSLYYCMQAQCRKPEFYKHRQCRVLRERDEVE